MIIFNDKHYHYTYLQQYNVRWYWGTLKSWVKIFRLLNRISSKTSVKLLFYTTHISVLDIYNISVWTADN